MGISELLSNIIVSDNLPEGTMVVWNPPRVQIEFQGDKIIAYWDRVAVEKSLRDAVMITGIGKETNEIAVSGSCEGNG